MISRNNESVVSTHRQVSLNVTAKPATGLNDYPVQSTPVAAYKDPDIIPVEASFISPRTDLMPRSTPQVLLKRGFPQISQLPQGKI